ncbi:MAG: ComF family protein [Erythrobacter sp.]
MNFGSHLAEGLKPLVDLVYPPRCPLCGAALARQGGLCGDCWGTLAFPEDPAERPGHIPVAAATLYNDTSRQLVLNLKHGRKIALAGLMGRLMAARLKDPRPGKPPPLLIPVPLHRWRLWHRGFNQAALLARELARRGKGDLLVDGLVRKRRTPSLGGLGRGAREKALSGAIGVSSSRARMVAGRRVILVDDVLTSGATTQACVTALLAGGARSVEIACFARVAVGSDSVTPESQRPRP